MIARTTLAAGLAAASAGLATAETTRSDRPAPLTAPLWSPLRGVETGDAVRALYPVWISVGETALSVGSPGDDRRLNRCAAAEAARRMGVPWLAPIRPPGVLAPTAHVFAYAPAPPKSAAAQPAGAAEGDIDSPRPFPADIAESAGCEARRRTR